MERGSKRRVTRPQATTRSDRTQQRREAIALSALHTFSERGYAATRMEDVAREAGVAKGTIYLHFRDKQALFEEIVRTVLVSPIRDVSADAPRPDETVRAFLERRFVPLLSDIGNSRRGDVIRLMVAEGSRFPELAETYHREVVQAGMTLLVALARRARETGEIEHDLLERFPQLLVAPALVGLVWGGMFERFHHLDVPGLIRAQLDLIFAPRPQDRPAPPGA